MRIMQWMVGLVSAVALAGAAQGAVIDFEDLTAGTQYQVGDAIDTDGSTLAVSSFTWSSGNPTSSGFAEVGTDSLAGAAGNEMAVNNVNLDLQIPVPLTGVSLQFGEYGGNVNLEINGDFRNVGNFTDLDGATVGGVNVQALAAGTPGNSSGALFAMGPIDSFSIGGQELWVDNLIASAVPEPASAALLGLGGVLLLGRRRRTA
ncbi:MAG: PEP-CTERM sorting domain-containing protein [Phycisphaeraceae bacterium]